MYIYILIFIQKAVCDVTKIAAIPSSYTQMPAQALEYALAAISLPPEVNIN